MGKKGSSKKAPNSTCGHQMSLTLREASTGKKQGNVNAKSMLKLEHIKNLASWASGEASIPSLGALFGHHLAASTEALGIPPDPSLFTCQRCESILQPGYNCTIRIEKNITKAQHRRKKAVLRPQNNVVYYCHFCSHRNLKRGTPKGYMKEICPPKAKAPPKSEPIKATFCASANSNRINIDDSEIQKMDGVASSDMAKENPVANSPATPSERTGLTLLEAKQRRRNRSGAKKARESASATVDVENADNTSNKRRRKSWTSLKEIALNNENDGDRKFINLTIPFSM